MNTLDCAIAYMQRGWRVVPIPHGRKAPTLKRWQSLRIEMSELSTRFPDAQASNIGVLLGEPSNWLVDIDLDSQLALDRADEFLPCTPAMFGRPAKPRSHRLYRVTKPIESKKFRSRAHGMLVEIRATGAQTVFPPSVHPSGESVTWLDPDAIPAEVDPWELFQAVERLANAVLEELGERLPRVHRAAPPSMPASPRSGATQDRLSACLTAMKRMRARADEHDGSHRLFAAACRAIEFDLDEAQAIACIREYATHRPFPREWTDQEIVERLRDAETTAQRGAVEQKKPGRSRSQATTLVGLCDELDLFHDDDVAYASLNINGCLETFKLRSSQFRSWMSRWFFKHEGTAVGGQALADAISALEGKARFEGPQVKVHVRLASHQNSIYLDLANAERQVIRIAPEGWSVAADPPVRFRRPRGLLELPMPRAGSESLGELRQFINVEHDSFILMVAWLVAALRPGWPVPLLIFNSEQGSGKSTASRLLRLLIDPNTAPIRCQPKEPRDLMIAATNSLVIGLDNLSSVPAWLSDALCRVSTGGGFSTRVLYENDDEMIFEALRPVILNGIDDVATRSDLLDRALRISLPSIPEDKRRPERIIYEQFAAMRPAFLGSLLTAVSTALARVNSVSMDRLPRMADFAQWILAAEPALPWQPGEFIRVYGQNRAGAHELAIESSPIGEVLVRFAQHHTEWTGTASELLNGLSVMAGEAALRQADWPKKPHSLSGALKRIVPNLRAAHVLVEFPNRTGRRRPITIRTLSRNSVTGVIERHNGTLSGCNGLDGDACQRLDDASVTLAQCGNHLDVTLDDAGDAQSPRCSDQGDDRDDTR